MPKAEEGLGPSNRDEAHRDAEISVDVNALSQLTSSTPHEYLLDGGPPATSTQPNTIPNDAAAQTNTTTEVSSTNSANSTNSTPNGAAAQTNTTTEVSTPNGAAAQTNTATTRGVGERRDEDDNNQVKLAKIFLGLFFQAAIALLMYRVQPQPQQGDSSANLSPQPKPQQGDSSTNLSSLPSVQFNTLWATTLFGFAFTMLATMLRKRHGKAANFCGYVGVFLGALGFFLMINIVADKRLDWLVWAVGGVLFVVFGFTLCEEMGI